MDRVTPQLELNRSHLLILRQRIALRTVFLGGIAAFSHGCANRLAKSVVELLELGRHATLARRRRAVCERLVGFAGNVDEDEEPAIRRAANTGDVGGCLANRPKDGRADALLDSGLLWQFVAFAKRQGG